MTQGDYLCFRSGMKIVIIALITGIMAIFGVAVTGFVQVDRVWNDIFR